MIHPPAYSYRLLSPQAFRNQYPSLTHEIIALDLGATKTGIAKTFAQQRYAQPVAIVETRRLADHLVPIVKQGITGFIVGKPLDGNGEEDTQTRKIKIILETVMDQLKRTLFRLHNPEKEDKEVIAVERGIVREVIPPMNKDTLHSYINNAERCKTDPSSSGTKSTNASKLSDVVAQESTVCSQTLACIPDILFVDERYSSSAARTRVATSRKDRSEARARKGNSHNNPILDKRRKLAQIDDMAAAWFLEAYIQRSR